MNDQRFPKQTEAQATGKLGAALFEALVRRSLAWDYRSTPQESDFGIDGYVDIIAAGGFVTGKSIAVQIKAGNSYFTEETADGWLYRGELKHLNYYLNLPAPVILVLVDPSTSRAWWRRFDPNATTRTAAGWTTTISRSQEFTASAEPILRGVAGDAVDYLPHLEHFWMVNSQISESALIAVVISRQEIERQDTAPFEDLLLRLGVSRDVALGAQGKVDFFILGYDDDQRELYEVPEVRKWVRQAAVNVRCLVWFLDMRPEAQGMIIVSACISRTTSIQLEHVELEREDLLEFVSQQFDRLNEFAAQFALPKEKIDEVSAALVRKVGLIADSGRTSPQDRAKPNRAKTERRRRRLPGK